MQIENWSDVNHGIMVARCNPLHLGHEAVKNEMIRTFGIDDCMTMLGSANAGISMRHIFSYMERRNLIAKVYPDLKVIGIPDFPTNAEWFRLLDDLLIARGFDPAKTVFFGGCEEDVSVLLESGRKCHIINRFDGTTPKISATEVRDALIHKRSLNGMINPLIQEDVAELFEKKWELLKKM